MIKSIRLYKNERKMSKTLGTRKIIALILCVVFLVATILTAPREIYTFKALDGSPGQDVSTLLSNIIVSRN